MADFDDASIAKIVKVVRRVLRESPPRQELGPLSPRWPDSLWVKLTGAAAGAGKYQGRVLAAPATAVDPAFNLTEAEIGKDQSSNPIVLMLNTAEVGATSGHVLDASFLPNVFLCRASPQCATTGKPVYIFECAAQFEDQDCGAS